MPLCSKSATANDPTLTRANVNRLLNVLHRTKRRYSKIDALENNKRKIIFKAPFSMLKRQGRVKSLYTAALRALTFI